MRERERERERERRGYYTCAVEFEGKFLSLTDTRGKIGRLEDFIESHRDGDDIPSAECTIGVVAECEDLLLLQPHPDVRRSIDISI